MENLTQKNKNDEVYEETEVKIEGVGIDVDKVDETEINPLKQTILNEIARYSPHSEVLTLSTLMAVNQGVHICNISPPGQGKSRNTGELLKLLRIPFSLIAGHTTPRQFFNELSKDGIIIVDEGATILSDKNIVNLLLNALWNGKVEWKNNKELLTHNFQGVIIFNVNKLSNTGLTEALKDRIFVNELNLKSEEIKDKILSSRDYTPNMEVWAEIRERLSLEHKSDMMSEKGHCGHHKCPANTSNSRILSPNNQKGHFKPLFSKLYHLIESGQEIRSVREINKLRLIANFSEILIGDLTLIDYFRETDEVWKIINMNIQRSDKVKRIAEAKCITERHARRILNKLEQIEEEEENENE
jgi:hypothetical protein